MFVRQQVNENYCFGNCHSFNNTPRGFCRMQRDAMEWLVPVQRQLRHGRPVPRAINPRRPGRHLWRHRPRGGTDLFPARLRSVVHTMIHMYRSAHHFTNI